MNDPVDNRDVADLADIVEQPSEHHVVWLAGSFEILGNGCEVALVVGLERAPRFKQRLR